MSLSSLFPIGGDTRGQAYTLEAIIAAVLVFTVVMFIAPSFATPTSNADTDQAQEHEQIESEVEAMLEQHAADGALKESILNYNDAEGEWANGFVEPSNGHYIRPPNDEFGQSIEDIENRHNVTVNVYLIPESTPSEPENPDRVRFLTQSANANVITSETVTLTLYEQTRLQSESEIHTRQGTALRQYLGDGDQLSNTTNYPIEPAANQPATDESVYNVVTVRVVVVDTPSPS